MKLYKGNCLLIALIIIASFFAFGYWVWVSP